MFSMGWFSVMVLVVWLVKGVVFERYNEAQEGFKE